MSCSCKGKEWHRGTVPFGPFWGVLLAYLYLKRFEKIIIRYIFAVQFGRNGHLDEYKYKDYEDSIEK
jgi:hypothetical protein